MIQSPPSVAAVPRRVDGDLLLAVAALLIFNSHLESLYPRPWLAADGQLGNTMFFLLSGYGVQSSLIAKRQAFAGYFQRRLLRLYPTVLIASLVIGLPALLAAAARGPLPIVGYMIWPTAYTYVATIVPVYIAIFLIGRSGSSRPVVIVSAVLLLALLAFTFWDATQITPGTRLSIGERPRAVVELYYPTVAFAGATLATCRLVPHLTVARLGAGAVLLLVYFGLKFAMVVQARFVEFYPLLFLLTLAACMLALSTLGDVRAVNLLPASLRRAIRWLALHTLEIYAIHQPLLHYDIFRRLVFPLNIAALLFVTLIGAVVVRALSQRIRSAIEPAEVVPASAAVTGPATDPATASATRCSEKSL